MRLGRIAAGFAQGAPLAQKIPALIQLDLDLCQALALVRSELALLEQPVLFGHQLLDMSEYRHILSLLFHGCPRLRNGLTTHNSPRRGECCGVTPLSSAWLQLGGSCRQAE